MTDEIARAEQAKYEAIWGLDQYRVRSPGLRMLDRALKMLRPVSDGSFTDWGCGTGRVAHALHDQGYPVRLVDIAPNAYRGGLPFVHACLWRLPENLPASDYGYCADVIEHIPPEKVQDVLEGIAKRTTKACYFQIAMFDDHHGDAIGETLHLSVFPAEWWKRRILRSFKRAEFKVFGGKHLLAVAYP